jgi:hypothetical protein
MYEKAYYLVFNAFQFCFISIPDNLWVCMMSEYYGIYNSEHLCIDGSPLSLGVTSTFCVEKGLLGDPHLSTR